MFRKMVRIKQQIPEDQCIELLKHEKRGVLSVLGDDDYPYGMPINHFIMTKMERYTFIVARSVIRWMPY